MAGRSTGRPRKSTKTLKLHGRYRKDRHGDRFDDSVLPPLGAKPDWLTPTASEFWDAFVKSDMAGIATELDAPMLAGMAEWWALWRNAVAGNARNVAWKHFVNAAAKFGLSPADRARLDIKAPSRPDEFDEFLKSTQF